MCEWLPQANGLFSGYTLQKTMGSGADLFDEGDWQAGGSTSWQYIVSGSALVGGSQLAQDRTAAWNHMYPACNHMYPACNHVYPACNHMCC